MDIKMFMVCSLCLMIWRSSHTLLSVKESKSWYGDLDLKQWCKEIFIATMMFILFRSYRYTEKI